MVFFTKEGSGTISAAKRRPRRRMEVIPRQMHPQRESSERAGSTSGWGSNVQVATMAKKKRTGLHQRRRLLPWAERVEERILLATFTVSNTNDSGPGSLRNTISEANGTPGLNTINFNFGTTTTPYVISVQTPLPAITNPVVLNG